MRAKSEECSGHLLALTDLVGGQGRASVSEVRARGVWEDEGVRFPQGKDGRSSSSHCRGHLLALKIERGGVIPKNRRTEGALTNWPEIAALAISLL
jgi:hypothetical protein